MAQSRQKLHNTLVGVVGDSGTKVYYQPPSSTMIQYPAIVYSRSDVVVRHADNSTHSLHWVYSATFISLDPDSPIPELLIRLPNARFVRSDTIDGLYHYTIEIHN